MKGAIGKYAIVTAAYWSFMLTDGALRMMVLLYFHEQGYTPIQLASVFLLYELCGVITNLWGGWLGCRFGLRLTLLAGLGLQVVALLGLAELGASWTHGLAMAYVMLAQALSGVAKDLTKMSSKTAVKYLAPRGEGGGLFRWVAVLTGSKNVVKGIGFFVGAALLSGLGFAVALRVMAGGIALVLMGAVCCLQGSLGEIRSKPAVRSLFRQSRSIRCLSMARLFLFGARDVWFVVGVPTWFAAVLGWSFMEIGAFCAAWVIVYGVVQAVAPAVLARGPRWRLADGRVSLELTAAAMLCLLSIAAGLLAGGSPGPLMIGGLFLFGVFFALNSAVHSYLILAYADHGKAAADVGFYYMANAGGRLIGTLVSGVLYQFGGILACLLGAAAFLLTAVLVSTKLPPVGDEADRQSSTDEGRRATPAALTGGDAHA